MHRIADLHQVADPLFLALRVRRRHETVSPRVGEHLEDLVAPDRPRVLDRHERERLIGERVEVNARTERLWTPSSSRRAGSSPTVAIRISSSSLSARRTEPRGGSRRGRQESPKASTVASMPQIGPKSRTTCFWMAAVACIRLRVLTSLVEERRRCVGSGKVPPLDVSARSERVERVDLA